MLVYRVVGNTWNVFLNNSHNQVNRKEGNDPQSILPSKTPKGKKDALKAEGTQYVCLALSREHFKCVSKYFSLPSNVIILMGTVEMCFLILLIFK